MTSKYIIKEIWELSVFFQIASLLGGFNSNVHCKSPPQGVLERLFFTAYINGLMFLRTHFGRN